MRAFADHVVFITGASSGIGAALVGAGKIIAVAAGCDPSGLLAARLSEKVAGLVNAEKVDVKSKGVARKQAESQPKK